MFAIRARDHHEVQDVMLAASRRATLWISLGDRRGPGVAPLGRVVFGFVGQDSRWWYGGYDDAALRDLTEPWRPALGLMTHIFEAGRGAEGGDTVFGTLPGSASSSCVGTEIGVASKSFGVRSDNLADA